MPNNSAVLNAINRTLDQLPTFHCRSCNQTRSKIGSRKKAGSTFVRCKMCLDAIAARKVAK